MPTKLSVNINKVATIRNTRALDIPSVSHLARIALEAGAHGITIHPRPDRRHIRPDDVPVLATLIKEFTGAKREGVGGGGGGEGGAEFNIEGNPFHGYMPHIRAVRPTQCTLVPDTTEQFTSDHGWDLTPDNIVLLKPVIAELRSLGCRVSLFMDATVHDMAKARDLGADRVELYTEPYAAAFIKGGDQFKRTLERYVHAAARADECELGINAGHDLNLHNLPPLVQAIPELAEVSIGHALIADALEFGMAETVRRYLRACGW